MSIENTLERIAAALEGIERKLNPAEVPVSEDAAPKPKLARSAPKPSATTTSPTADTKEETPSGDQASEQPAASGTADDQSALTYEVDVKPLILKVGAQKGRDAVLKLFADYEVKNGQELTAEQWPDFIASANEVLG